jgi:hypothetical protein
MKTRINNSFRNMAGLAAGVLMGLTFAAPAPVHAQDAKAEEKKGWESTAAVGLTYSSGNTKNFLATLDLASTRKWATDEVLLGAKAGYGETTKSAPGPGQDTDKTDAFIKGFSQYNHSFTERFYGAMRVDALHDDISDVYYRFSVAPLAGYYFTKKPATTLSADIGPSWVVEKVGAGPADPDGEMGARGYLGLRLGERFEHKFASGARLWQTADLTPEVENWENYVFNFTLGVSAPLTKALSVQVVADDTYDHQPVPGRLKNDFKLTAGLAYKF